MITSSRPITTHGRIRRLPHKGARHGTVDHGHPSEGVFLLLHLWVLPSRWSIPVRRSPSSLSLACGWPPSANGSFLPNGGTSRALGLKILRVQGRGANRRREWARPAGLGRPAQAHPGSVRSPLRFRGSSGDYAFCPLHLHYFDDVILASKMEVLCA
jgi:hypothetical protein